MCFLAEFASSRSNGTSVINQLTYQSIRIFAQENIKEQDKKPIGHYQLPKYIKNTEIRLKS